MPQITVRQANANSPSFLQAIFLSSVAQDILLIETIGLQNLGLTEAYKLVKRLPSSPKERNPLKLSITYTQIQVSKHKPCEPYFANVTFFKALSSVGAIDAM